MISISESTTALALITSHSPKTRPEKQIWSYSGFTRWICGFNRYGMCLSRLCFLLDPKPVGCPNHEGIFTWIWNGPLKIPKDPGIRRERMIGAPLYARSSRRQYSPQLSESHVLLQTRCLESNTVFLVIVSRSPGRSMRDWTLTKASSGHPSRCQCPL